MVGIPDSVGLVKHGLTILSTQQWTLSIHDKSDTKKSTHSVHFYDKNGGAWVERANVPMTAGASYNVPAQSGAIDAVGFSVESNGSTTELEIMAELSMSEALFTGAAFTALGTAFEQQIHDQNIQWGKVQSMSCLVQNTSADIYKSGNISAGRVPHKFNIFGNVTSNMAALPRNRVYQGPAANGAYAFWVPSQDDEYAIDQLDHKLAAYKESNYLLFKIDGWLDGSALRVQFDWIVEFYTPNQLFEKELCPPMTDEFRMLLFFVLSADAAMCNPEHSKILSALFSRGKGYFDAAKSHYTKHKALYDTLGSLALRAAEAAIAG
jgi:hypothetical protein